MRKLLLLGLFLAAGSTGLVCGATAQTTNTECWREPGGGQSCTSITTAPPVDHYTDAIIQAETYLALNPPPVGVRVYRATVWIKCNHVQGFEVDYTNGAIYRSTDAPETKSVDRNLLGNLKAMGVVVIEDKAGCE
jgi:hypothetical protein